jgi:hypothetical protein
LRGCGGPEADLVGADARDVPEEKERVVSAGREVRGRAREPPDSEHRLLVLGRGLGFRFRVRVV